MIVGEVRSVTVTFGKVVVIAAVVTVFAGGLLAADEDRGHLPVYRVTMDGNCRMPKPCWLV